MFPKHFSIEKNFKNEDQNLSLFSKKSKYIRSLMAVEVKKIEKIMLKIK